MSSLINRLSSKRLFSRSSRYSAMMALSLLLSSNMAFADWVSMDRVLKQQPVLTGFSMCRSGGCAEVLHVVISDEEWQQVRAVFDPVPENAAEERASISKAIGVMESIVGPKTGTSTDRAGTFGNSDYPGQMDCNDEAINSTNYMKLMQQDSLLHFHHILQPKKRGYFFNGWPHSTAAIGEIEGGQSFAVDSWFHDNGQPAEILPLDLWKSGWKPENTTAH
ncbi:MAG TPA: hypothetical protein VK974_12910 [Methylophilaceae bacterium]|nr:hypothetical protein [Methylophilaceae bacterium]